MTSGPRHSAGAPVGACITIIDYRPHQSGALQGWLAVELASGMRIHGIAVFDQAGRRWLGLPNKPRLRDGKATRATSGGYIQDPVVEILDRERKSAFDRQVLAALDAHLAQEVRS